MRPLSFSPVSLRKLLLHDKIATLPDLKRALGTDVDLTVFRKLKQLDYLTSYSHRGRFYTLREIAHFGARWFVVLRAAWFSRHGTLLATAGKRSSAARSRDILRKNCPPSCIGSAGCLTPTRPAEEDRPRVDLSGLFLYTSMNPVTRQQQRLTRRGNQSVPTVVDASRLEVSPDEMKAAIILFYSLLDEQQRRLYAALESMKLGHGGDSVLAEFLGLDPHTIARGRPQLLDRDVEVGRIRQPGAGRKPVEKKHPK